MIPMRTAKPLREPVNCAIDSKLGRSSFRVRAQVAPMPELLGLIVLAVGGWFVWDSLKVRESANAAMRAACRQAGLLFLDDTVALHSVWPARNGDGHLVLRRIYEFEYSDTGHNRRKGNITMVANDVVALYIGPHPIIEGEPLH